MGDKKVLLAQEEGPSVRMRCHMALEYKGAADRVSISALALSGARRNGNKGVIKQERLNKERDGAESSAEPGE